MRPKRRDWFRWYEITTEVLAISACGLLGAFVGWMAGIIFTPDPVATMLGELIGAGFAIGLLFHITRALAAAVAVWATCTALVPLAGGFSFRDDFPGFIFIGATFALLVLIGAGIAASLRWLRTSARRRIRISTRASAVP